MEPQQLGVVAYRRSLVGLAALGSLGLALTVPEIKESPVAHRMWIALVTCGAGGLVLGYFGSVRVAGDSLVSDQRRRGAWIGAIAMAVALVVVVSAAHSLSAGAALGAWCAACCLGMGMSMLVRLLQPHHK